MQKLWYVQVYKKATILQMEFENRLQKIPFSYKKERDCVKNNCLFSYFVS